MLEEKWSKILHMASSVSKNLIKMYFQLYFFPVQLPQETLRPFLWICNMRWELELICVHFQSGGPFSHLKAHSLLFTRIHTHTYTHSHTHAHTHTHTHKHSLSHTYTHTHTKFDHTFRNRCIGPVQHNDQFTCNL